MAWIFYEKIVNGDGDYTIEDVPKRWREAVEELLRKGAEDETSNSL